MNVVKNEQIFGQSPRNTCEFAEKVIDYLFSCHFFTKLTDEMDVPSSWSIGALRSTFYV